MKGGEPDDSFISQFRRSEATPDQGQDHNRPLSIKLWAASDCIGGWGGIGFNVMGGLGLSGCEGIQERENKSCEDGFILGSLGMILRRYADVGQNIKESQLVGKGELQPIRAREERPASSPQERQFSGCNPYVPVRRDPKSVFLS
jgi:hypothetical protein